MALKHLLKAGYKAGIIVQIIIIIIIKLAYNSMGRVVQVPITHTWNGVFTTDVDEYVKKISAKMTSYDPS